MAAVMHKNLLHILSLHSITRSTLIPNSFTQLRASATRAMSSESTQLVFQLKVDPLTGNSEWAVIKEEEQQGEGISAYSQKPLLATTSYLDMLNDSRRNKVYREAIEKTITKPCHVLDIGAGTGLLSMMAARAMDSLDSSPDCSDTSNTKGTITACESYLPMVKLMKKVLRHNGMQRKIKIINKRSDELQVGKDINSKADILVSEILDSELLGEGLIPTLQHAHDELLVENPQTVPYRATIYGQLVESEFLWKLHDLHSNEEKTCDGIHLVPKGLETSLSIKQQQYALHCNAIAEEINLLSEPFKVFEFDFWKRPESHGEIELHIKATGNGRAQAIVSWWILQLDSEGTLFYSTAPKWIHLPINKSPGNWCDHWKQCVWFIPGKGVSVSKDEDISLLALHSDTTISYQLRDKVSKTEVHGTNAESSKLTLSPERIAIHGDSGWRLAMIKGIRRALQGRDHSLCLVADDSIFLTFLAASLLSKTSHVISLLPGLRERGSQYLKAVLSANGISMDRVKVIGKSRTCLNMTDTCQKKINLLIGEPYYCGNDGGLPWQNLRFWKERTKLDSMLSDDVLIMPSKGILQACAISLPDLWNSRCFLSEIEGFDHSDVNSTLGACGRLLDGEEGPCLPFYIWQCGEYKQLSETFMVMEFDFSKAIGPCHGKAQVEVTRPGICHGFALWIDYVIDPENSIVLSTGPDKRCWKQGVKLLAKPVSVGIHESSTTGKFRSVVIEAEFDPSTAELNVKHSFS